MGSGVNLMVRWYRVVYTESGTRPEKRFLSGTFRPGYVGVAKT